MKLAESDIKRIVKSGEGYNAEFKIRIPAKVRELAEEVCAFANAKGGVLLLGVSDRNEIEGIEINNTKRSAIQDSLKQINPNLDCSFYFVEVDGKQLGVIDIPTGIQKPYTLSGAIYIRQGANSQKITSVEQMRDFFQQSGRVYFDEGICSKFSFENDFDKEFFKEFRLTTGFSPATEDMQIIRNLQLINDDGAFKNGSVLFFGNNPETFFEKAVMRCLSYEGTNKVQIIDDKIWGGYLMQQYQQAMQWLKTKLNVRYKIEGGGPRQEIWEIPETAIKEAIINALSHRDYYDKGGRIMIELFDDRMEITNPGGLVSAISLHELGTKSSSRNPLVFSLFQRIKMVEQVGSGINRIKDVINEAGLPEPIFKTEGMFTVVFSKPLKKTILKSSADSVIEKQELILWDKYGINTGYLRDKYGIQSVDILLAIHINPIITKPQLAKLRDLSLSTIEKLITKLKKDGLLKRIGSRKTGKWIIIKRE